MSSMNLIYSTSTNSAVEQLMKLHNILKTLPHNNKLAQHLNNFVRDSQFIRNLQVDQDNPGRERGGNVTTT